MKIPRLGKWWISAGVMIAVLATSGYIYEVKAERRDNELYTVPGKLVDVGGYRLHLYCTGEGSPTVVIESGWGELSSSWGWVQSEVAKTKRVCTYDRAGMGWSEMSPEPRTARVFAKELHTLLSNAGEIGPYLLVGHSLGGHTVRVYANDYPHEVVGLVLVDAQALPSAGTTPKPAPKPGKTNAGAILAQLGVTRVLANPLGAIRDLPEKDKGAYRALTVTPKSVQTFLDEGRGMSEGGAQAREVTTLGQLSLIVISRGRDQDEMWEQSQKEMVSLSTNSQRVFADQSGHEIMIEQPETIIEAIAKIEL